jgi:hypothetical protein
MISKSNRFIIPLYSYTDKLNDQIMRERYVGRKANFYKTSGGSLAIFFDEKNLSKNRLYVNPFYHWHESLFFQKKEITVPVVTVPVVTKLLLSYDTDFAYKLTNSELVKSIIYEYEGEYFIDLTFSSEISYMVDKTSYSKCFIAPRIITKKPNDYAYDAIVTYTNDEVKNDMECDSEETDKDEDDEDDLDMFNDNETKENNKMNFNIDNLKEQMLMGEGKRFGLSLSMNGKICFNGKYYDNGQLNDSLGLEFDMPFLYVMPKNKVEAGDTVIKLVNNKYSAYYFDGTNFISMADGLKASYVPVSVAGMTFYSVVQNFAGNMFSGGGSGNMANLMPLMLLSGKDGMLGGDKDTLMLIMMMQNGGLDFSKMFGGNANVEKSEDKK